VTPDSTNTPNELLKRIEAQYGPDEALRAKLLPSVQRIVEAWPETSKDRTKMLQKVMAVYSHQVRVRESLDDLDRDLSMELNQHYATSLGIENPRVG
jgi:hypothetical protein